nr:hydantoinase B/oxoprolinase family protein [Sphingomonas sp. Y57]
MTALSESPISPAGIELEILRHKLLAITHEMAAQLVNAAQNPEINEEKDFATAIIDLRGNVVAIDNPVLLGTVGGVARDIVDSFRFDMKDGDVVLSSDPDRGGGRVTDISLLRPYFHEHRVALYLMVQARVPDIGGWLQGGLFPGAVELWGEGVPFTPVKLYREGKRVRDLATTMLLNSRRPDDIETTLTAALATMEIGALRIRQLIGGYSITEVVAAMEYCQTYSERRTRSLISQWPNGHYESSVTLEHDGNGGGPVTVRLQAKVDDDHLTLDFGNSDDQRRAFINCTLGTTVGAALLPLLCLMGSDVPANGGLLAAVRVASTPGKVTSATGKAPVGWSRSHCSSEITEAVNKLLRQVAQPRFGTLTAPATLLFCRPESDRAARIDLGIWNISGQSGSGGLDGWGRPSVSSRGALPSVEEWEAAHPVSVRQLEYSEDTAGAGQWRGSAGFQVEFAMPPGFLFTTCRQDVAVGPAGTEGGKSGSGTTLESMDFAGSALKVAMVQTEDGLPGNLVRLTACGGGGHGSPLKRDAGAVFDDILDGLVSRTAARDLYGVLLATDGTAVDVMATEQLRQDLGDRHG